MFNDDNFKKILLSLMAIVLGVNGLGAATGAGSSTRESVIAERVQAVDQRLQRMESIIYDLIRDRK